jgi:hypothetical protein
MIYPVNIFSPDPVSKEIRPFVIFIPQKLETNVNKSVGYSSTTDLLSPKAPFVLPMPNNGLVDASDNQYDEQNSFEGDYNQAAIGMVNKGAQMMTPYVNISGNSAAQRGRLPDPRLTQVYMGTSSRSWTGTWQFIPQSVGEAAAAAAILGYVKYCGAPDRSANTKIGILLQPFVFKVIFSNPLIHLAMQFDQMALASYSIEYFAQGYASTYSDMMPKQMQLTMTFKEWGIKTRKDWGF